tara:strand:- start:1786 stop:2049 length:264 start_codon:yes stop_codon:yes gene_type:complete
MISIDLLKDKLSKKGVKILSDVYSALIRINDQECKTITINIEKYYSEYMIVELLINKFDCKQFAFFALLPKHLRVIVVKRYSESPDQ